MHEKEFASLDSVIAAGLMEILTGEFKRKVELQKAGLCQARSTSDDHRTRNFFSYLPAQQVL